MDWPIVAFLLGLGVLALGFYVVRTSARRQVSLLHIEERIAQLERRTAVAGEPMAMPRGLPGRLR